MRPPEKTPKEKREGKSLHPQRLKEPQTKGRKDSLIF